MKKYEKEILQAQLDNEKKVLNDLKESYDDALAQINGKIAQLLGRQDADLPHVIYQVEYQKMLKTQVQAILETLQTNEFQTVSEYLTASYNEGFIASQYAMQCQGVPLIFPINQEQVVQAVQHETKLSSPLYDELGHDIKELSKTIAGEISRGISSGQGYGEIARNLSSYANIPLNNAMRIARTESHRIQCKSAMDAQYKAKSKGADVVKEWNAFYDGKTRPHHRKLDGQIREIEEPFEVAGFKPMYPGDFGDPAEDCNCRCALLQRARWELDDEETQYLGDTSSMTEEQREEIAGKLGIPVDELDNYSESIVPLNATSLDDFKEKYNNIWHYEGSEEQRINLAIAEQTRQDILSQRGRSSVQKTQKVAETLENTGKSGIILSEWNNDLKPCGQRGHIDEDKLYSYVAEELGISEDKATEYVDSVLSFTGNEAYSDIRRYQRGESTVNITEDEAKKLADSIESYIKEAPRWNGGMTYRGASLPDVELAMYAPGKEVSMGGVASWSATQSIAEEFAMHNASDDRPNSVIFHCETQSKGTGIQHLSVFEGENEVLCSEASRYTIVRTEEDANHIIHVYLEEVI